MKITFLGGAGGVTGANHLVESENLKLIIDCGLYQSGKMIDELNYQNFAYDPTTLKYALITHSHLDHVGRLPKLYHNGFRGQILATAPTRDLAKLILEDAFKIMKEECQWEKKKMLYEEKDVADVLSLFETIDYEQEIKLNNKVSATFFDAGHVLGSAMILIKEKKFKTEKRIIFSGDFGNSPAPILRSPTAIDKADYVVVESAYGNRNHEKVADREKILEEIVSNIIKEKGVLLIPAFSLERTQELLYFFNNMVEKNHIPRVPVFIDSPLAIKTTEVFRQYPEFYNKEASILAKTDSDLFSFPGLIVTTTSDKSRNIKKVRMPKIIIAGSGMMYGGRILDHLIDYLGLPKCTLLIVGFQLRGSVGRRLLEGAKLIRVKGKEIRVRGKVMALGAMSAHGDSNHLFEWVKNIKGIRKVFVVQGDPDAANFLADRVRRGTKALAMAPGLGYSEEL